ncbi:DUF6385 domain-containing protein [Saccharomonospora piscinae]|uniref:Uncharacterized protein n=1 Tax=Saccharomonospora piscinae TaxID=687388 RepID=A0A1V8ZY18_SACPI|nr:DUF6385 domain-containing protein [Saccharomonospora piscinae]OQO89574.1 hypothetical protein B1813_21880 [Saccharomonospora piscinae]TLW91263.1 hypothetical protein FFT09_18590 [Saccharomonospora piscinae]
MRQSQAAVLERYRVLRGDFTTEPFEAGWAGEARWFVQVLETSQPSTRLVVTTQLSPDGLHWCDAEVETQVAEGTTILTWPVREFGQWLRIRGTVEDEGSAKVQIYLTLKE